MAGALLYAWLHNRLGIVRLVDGFVYVAIPVLVIFHTWTNQGNVWAFVALFLGVIIPFIIERLSQKLAPHTDNMALLAGISGLFLHAFLEGAALSIPKEVYFTYAVLLHRIPVGIMIWWLLHPRPWINDGFSWHCRNRYSHTHRIHRGNAGLRRRQ